MKYWVVKARPQNVRDLKRCKIGERELWWAGSKPREIEVGDRLFLWQGARVSQVCALARLATPIPNKPRGRERQFRIIHETGALDAPVSQDALRFEFAKQMPSFLKAGAAGTFFPLTEAEAKVVWRLVRDRNPRIAGVWKSWSSGSSSRDKGVELKGLVPVRSIAEVRQSLRSFLSGVRSSRKRARSLARQTSYWVHDTRFGTFGPSKFVGYRRMTFARYEAAAVGRLGGAPFDGTVSRTAVEGAVGVKYAPNSQLSTRFTNWAKSRLGTAILSGVDSTKWRFISLPTERGSTSEAPPGSRRRGATSRGNREDNPDQATAVEGIATEVLRYTRGRSARLRKAALELARGICATCDRDYSRFLDGDGIRVLQVHHKKQLSSRDVPTPTRVSELAVLCANCHALVHLDPQRAMPVSKLRRRLGT